MPLKRKGAPIEAIIPEGKVMGYALGGVSIIKNARNLDNAKLFMDWVLSKEAQEILGKTRCLPNPNKHQRRSCSTINQSRSVRLCGN